MSERVSNEHSLAPKSPAQAWRRRVTAIGLVGALGTGVGFAVNWAVDRIEHYDDPVPAACDVSLRQGGTMWGIAEQIAAHTNQETGEVEFDLSRANPGVDAGHIEPGDPVGIPEQYCGVVEQYGIGQ